MAYLALLIGIAIIGVVAAGTVQLGALYRRRAAEKELLYIGDQFQRALLSYADNTPVGQPTQPRTLDELVRDPRYPNPMRHLRRVYADPLTGKTDWVLILSPNGQTIVGIHSASHAHPIQLRQFPERFRGFEDKLSYTDWVFVPRPPQLAQGARAPNSPVGGVPLPGAPLPVDAEGNGTAGMPDMPGVPAGSGNSADAAATTNSGSASGDGFFGSGRGFSGGGGFSSGNGLSNGGGISGADGFSSGNGAHN